MVHHPLTPSPSLLLTSHQLPLDDTLQCSATWPTPQPCPASTSLFQVRSRYSLRHILYAHWELEFSTVGIGGCSFQLWGWGMGGCSFQLWRWGMGRCSFRLWRWGGGGLWAFRRLAASGLYMHTCDIHVVH